MLESFFSVDGAILLWIQENLRGALDPVVEFYTKLGSIGLIWIVLSFLMLCFRSTRRAGMVAMLAMLLGLLCANGVLKHLAARPRPWLDVEGLIPLIDEKDPNSFPSGHACAAFACAAVWWKSLPKRWMAIVGLALAACMAFSRLYVGVHYPSDVLIGALVGWLCGWVAYRVTRGIWTKI